MLRLYLILILILIVGFWFLKKLKQTSVQKYRRELLSLNEDNEDLQKLKVVTNQLISIETEYSKTETGILLGKVIDLQVEIIKLFSQNPENITENSKRLILYYSNSILNVLEHWKELKQKLSDYGLVPEGDQKITELLNKWIELLQNIRLKLLDKKYALLDAEIQALIDGLKLDS